MLRFPWDEIADLYTRGVPVSILEKTYGFTHRSLYNNLKRLNIPTRGRKVGPEHHHWKGGRTKSGKYWYVWVSPDDPMLCMASASTHRKNLRVAEHRLVMARNLGRPLTSVESVHHIDGNTSNNDLSNLQLRYRYHGDGIRYECESCGSLNVRPVNL